MRPVRVLSVLLIVAASQFAIACGSDDSGDSGGTSSADTWRIGLEGPLTGEQSGVGQGMLKGAQMAASQLNSQGGLLDKDVEIIPIDDKADPATGVTAANEAIEAGLDGVVGPYNSGVGLETLPLYIKDGLVPIRLTSDNATDNMGYTLQPMTDEIAPVAAEAMTKWLGAKTVAIAYDPTTPYTKTVSSGVKSELEGMGVKVVAMEKIQPGESDYADAVTKLGDTGADVVYAAVYYPEGAAIAKEMLSQNIKSQCLADYGSYDTGFITDAGEAAAKNCPVVGVPAPDDFQGSEQLNKDFKQDFGEAAGTWSPYAYDSVNLLADAVKSEGSFDSTKLNEYLDAVDGWKGWTGSVTIDAKTGNRDPATVVVTSVNQDGGFSVDSEWSKAVDAPY